MLLDSIGKSDLKHQLHKQLTRHSTMSKTEECLIRYLRTLDTDDFKYAYRKLWEVDCELYQYSCKEMYYKIVALGKSKEKHVLC